MLAALGLGPLASPGGRRREGCEAVLCLIRLFFHRLRLHLNIPPNSLAGCDLILIFSNEEEIYLNICRSDRSKRRKIQHSKTREWTSCG